MCIHLLLNGFLLWAALILLVLLTPYGTLTIYPLLPFAFFLSYILISLTVSYDNVQSFADFSPFGGWNNPVMKVMFYLTLRGLHDFLLSTSNTMVTKPHAALV